MEKLGTEIVAGDILVGGMGGLSAVYDNQSSSSMPGFMAVETEHGFLYLDPENYYVVSQ